MPLPQQQSLAGKRLVPSNYLLRPTPIGNLLSDLSVKFFCVSCGYSNKGSIPPKHRSIFLRRYGFAWVTGALFLITLSGHWIFG